MTGAVPGHHQARCAHAQHAAHCVQGKGHFEGDPSAWALQLSAKGSEQAPLDLKQELQLFRSTCKQLGTELVERNEQIKGDPMCARAAGRTGQAWHTVSSTQISLLKC